MLILATLISIGQLSMETTHHCYFFTELQLKYNCTSTHLLLYIVIKNAVTVIVIVIVLITIIYAYPGNVNLNSSTLLCKINNSSLPITELNYWAWWTIKCSIKHCGLNHQNGDGKRQVCECVLQIICPYFPKSLACACHFMSEIEGICLIITFNFGCSLSF